MLSETCSVTRSAPEAGGGTWCRNVPLMGNSKYFCWGSELYGFDSNPKACSLEPSQNYRMRLICNLMRPQNAQMSPKTIEKVLLCSDVNADIQASSLQLIDPPHFDHTRTIATNDPSSKRGINARQCCNNVLVVLQQVLLVVGN